MDIVIILKIIAKIIELIAEGMSSSAACGCAAGIFNLDVEEVKNIWNNWGI